MQALTPLLFSMLFPRSNPTPERRNSDIDESEHSQDTQSSIDRRYSFNDGYILDREEPISTNARRHRSLGPSQSNNTLTATSSSSNPINRNSGSHLHRKTNPPKRISTDHAAFMATYPMLDGLGDTVRTSESEYYSPLTTASPKPKARKQRSQEGMRSSRASTSSMCSLASDDSSLSTSYSLREPLTPTRSPTDYHSIIRMESNKNSEENGRRSPQSNNFFDDSEMMNYKTNVSIESRGQRQLIAH